MYTVTCTDKRVPLEGVRRCAAQIERMRLLGAVLEGVPAPTTLAPTDEYDE
jgi:hypothetical protein